MFLDVAKFTNLTPLSLLILCKLSFPTVSLKISSLPTLALECPNRILKLVDCSTVTAPASVAVGAVADSASGVGVVCLTVVDKAAVLYSAAVSAAWATAALAR
jgi:hypothetical protein